jgi:hypothetical protein
MRNDDFFEAVDKFSGVIAESFATDEQLSKNGDVSEWQYRLVWALRDAISIVKRDMDLITINRNEDRAFVACILQAWDRFTIHKKNMATLLKSNISSWLPEGNLTAKMLEGYAAGYLPPGSLNEARKILPYPDSEPVPDFIKYGKSSIVGPGATPSASAKLIVPKASSAQHMPGSWPSDSTTHSSISSATTIFYSAASYASPWRVNQYSGGTAKHFQTVLSEHQTILSQRQLLSPPDLLRDWSGRGKHAEYQSWEVVPLESLQQIGCSLTAVVDKVRCRRILLARKSMTCRGRFKLETAINEVEHLQRLRHAHIIQLVGSYLQGKNFSILLYPVADYDIKRFMQEYRASLSQRNGSIASACSMVRFFGCLAHALYYIHSKLTKHLDIKPQNILVKRRYHQKAPNSGAPHAHYHVYIADFGLSKSFSTEAQSQTDSASPKTPKYCAPEVYYQEAKGRSADIFSMGCVYLEMMTVIHGGSLDDIDDIIKSPNGSLSYRENIDNAIRWLSQLNMTLVPWDTWALGANSGFGCARKSMMLATISHMLDPDKEERVTSEEVSQFIGEHDCCN